MSTNGKSQEKAPAIVVRLNNAAAREKLATALPKHMSADHLVRTVLNAIQQNNALLKCTTDSVWDAVMKCAELGLEPGSALGHAYLIPYGERCQLVIGYKGMLVLARRSGEIESITAYIVHEKDEFHVEYGLEPKLRHVPFFEGDPGKPRLAYAVGRMKGGGVQFEVMSLTQIEAVRRRGSNRKGSPWDSDWEEMARKTVLRRIFKLLPMSVELQHFQTLQHAQDVLEGDVLGESLEGDGAAHALPAGTQSRSDSLSQMLNEEAPEKASSAPAPEAPPAT